MVCREKQQILENIQKIKLKKIMVVSSTILFSLVFALPHWYLLFEKEKTPTNSSSTR